MQRVILLSLTASLNPTLLAASTIMLLLDRPAKLMAGYLAGAYLTSITLGLIIVFSLSSSGAVTTTQRTLSPAADIVLGVLALGLALALRSERADRARERWAARGAAKAEQGPPRWQRELSKGSPRTTFVIGALLTLPGASYLAGLLQIHRLGYSTGATVLVVVGFNLVQLWLLEVPMAAFFVAPDRTADRIALARAWLGQHARGVAIRGFAAIGVLLIVKGLIGLLA